MDESFKKDFLLEKRDPNKKISPGLQKAARG
jgi:hypothetical protein